MVNATQTVRKATVQPSISHNNVLCIRQAFATQVQTKAAAREMIISTMHQKAAAEISTRSFAERRLASLVHSLSILSAIFRQIFSPSCSSVFLADCDRACPMQGRNSPVHFGQGFRKSVFELFHVSTKNADGFIIVFQRVGHAVSFLHLFGSRKRPVYFREIEFFIQPLPLSCPAFPSLQGDYVLFSPYVPFIRESGFWELELSGLQFLRPAE